MNNGVAMKISLPMGEQVVGGRTLLGIGAGMTVSTAIDPNQV